MPPLRSSAHGGPTAADSEDGEVALDPDAQASDAHVITLVSRCRVPSTRVYGGATGDERWSERRAQLMSAGLELLASADGARAFTVRGVCRQARLTSRYFYEHFGDAGELATAIYDEEVFKLTTVTLAAMDGVPDDIPLVTRAAIGALIDQVAEDPRRGRLLFSPALLAVPAIACLLYTSPSPRDRS